MFDVLIIGAGPAGKAAAVQAAAFKLSVVVLAKDEPRHAEAPENVLLNLPEIAKSLNTGGGIAQLSTTAYYCGFAIGIFTLGRVSDIFGRKPVVLFGISFYSIAALLISYSPNIEIFISLRFLQAYGASVGSVVGQAMTRDSYRGGELSYMYASVAMVMAVVPSIGSAIGGYIVEYSNWQAVFRFLSVLSTGLLLIYIKFLPETLKRENISLATLDEALVAADIVCVLVKHKDFTKMKALISKQRYLLDVVGLLA